MTFLTTIDWNVIDGSSGDMPEPKKEILIFDEELDDLFFGHLDMDSGLPVWIEQQTGDQLLKATFWAEKPFPFNEYIN